MKRAALPDQEARDAIRLQTDLSMVVEAGAGSGKTTCLTERMVGVLREGKARIDAMAAITFTRKAAGELRGRFQTGLEDALRLEEDPKAKGRLQEALAGLEHLFTGTIHAFCARILRERPVEAQVPPGFREIEAEEDDRLRDQAWRDHVAELHARGDESLGLLAGHGIRPADLEEAFRTVCTFPEAEFPAERIDPPDPQAAWAQFQAFWEPFNGRLPEAFPASSACKFQRRIDQIQTLLRFSDFSDRARARPSELARLLECFKELEAGDARLLDWSLGAEEVRKLQAQFSDFARGPAESYLKNWRAHLYPLVLEGILAARERAALARRREGLLNYTDLLFLAAALLRENLQAREFFRERFTHLFVDEFQDTDPLQAEVISLVAAGPGRQRDWTKLAPRPGSLFIVGDPKQSIYRFRRADIEVFRQMRAVIERSGGRHVELTANFRSGHAILSWLDGTFGRIFPEKETPEQPAHLALEPAGLGAGNAGRVAALTTPGKVRFHGAHLHDADQIAKFIRHAVDSGLSLRIGSRGDEGRRAARFGDFLILTWKKVHLGAYAEALERYGIPFEASGVESFSDVPQVRRLAQLSLCLAQPDDAVSVVGILRGPLFGMTDDALYRHRKAGGAFAFAGEIPKEGDPEVRGALERLSGFHALTRRLTPGGAMEQLLEETGLLAQAASGAGAGLAGGGIFTALERVRAAADAGLPFPEIALSLARSLDSGDVESAALEPGRPEVVRLMNLHKAKGLEAPVVFLADPCVHLKGKPRVRILRRGGRSTGFLSARRAAGEHQTASLAEPADWEEHAGREEAFLRAERDRLRYVAATRAREILVISRRSQKKSDADVEEGSRPWLAFEPHLKDLPELEVPAQVSRPARETPDLSAEAQQEAARKRAARIVSAAAPSFSMSGVTRLVHREEEEGVLAQPAAAPGDPSGGAGREWGTLVHGVLEAAMRSGAPLSREELEAVARVLASDDPGLSLQAGRAAEIALEIGKSALWREARASSECHAEAPLELSLSREELAAWSGVAAKFGDPPVALLQGVVDLAYRVDGGWAIVDYKTDQVGPGARDLDRLRDFYAPQVRLYARAWERISGQKVMRAGLFFLRPGRVLWVSRL